MAGILAPSEAKLRPNTMYQIIWKIEKFLEIPDHGFPGIIFKINGIVMTVKIDKESKSIKLMCNDNNLVCNLTLLNTVMTKNAVVKSKMDYIYSFTLHKRKVWANFCDKSELTLKFELVDGDGPQDKADTMDKSVLLIETNAFEINLNCVTEFITTGQRISIRFQDKDYKFLFMNLNGEEMGICTSSLSYNEFVCFKVTNESQLEQIVNSAKRTTFHTRNNSMTLTKFYKTTVHDGSTLKEPSKTPKHPLTPQQQNSTAEPLSKMVKLVPTQQLIQYNPSVFDMFIADTLFNSKKFSDFTILVQGVRIKAHKFILAKRCTLWRNDQPGTPSSSSSSTPPPPPEDKVDLETISEWTETNFNLDTMNALLKFIYTNRPPTCMTDQLMLAALAYGVADLKLISERALIVRTKIENAVTMLSLSEKHELHNLKEHVLSFIKKNIRGPAGKELFNELIEYSRDVAFDLLK